MRSLVVLLHFIFITTIRSEYLESNGLYFVNEKSLNQNLPILQLPYGKYQASKYDAHNDVYHFQNIRYAAPPTGEYRWAKPMPPEVTHEVQTGKQGGTCYQSFPEKILSSALTGGMISAVLPGMLTATLDFLTSIIVSLIQKPSFMMRVTQFFDFVDLGKVVGGGPTQEDCLFLDVFVPAKALRGEIRDLPVVDYIHGGAYILGQKDHLYQGADLVGASNGSMIYVIGNYRMGVFGFLTGDTAEKHDVANAGLWDQRAVLEWIQKYISLIGGDPDNVSLWGQSAGGGSIMHHLVAFKGQDSKLFAKAAILSPGASPSVDRQGRLEQQFEKLLKMSGCSGGGLECLRGIDAATLKVVGDQIIADAPPCRFGFGPAVDGAFIAASPNEELDQGNHFELSSLLITLVADEGIGLSPVDSSTGLFEATIQSQYSPILASMILNSYPPPTPLTNYKTERERFARYMTDSTFVCQAYSLALAFSEQTYFGMFKRDLGIHGSDLTYIFKTGKSWANKQYQKLLVNHALSTSDDVQIKSSIGGPIWSKAKFDSQKLNKVFTFENGNDKNAFNEDAYIDFSEHNCELWSLVWKSMAEEIKDSGNATVSLGDIEEDIQYFGNHSVS